MVEVNYKVFMVGMICLAIMYMVALFCDVDGEAVLSLLSGLLGLMAGVMIPAPRVNKEGMMKW